MNRFLIFLTAAFPLFIATIAIISKGSIKSYFMEEDPLLIVCIWALVFALCSFIGGISTNDYSWVDRLWSTLPIGFAFFYVYRSNFKQTSIIQGILVAIWGLRLTYNFARKGGYDKAEDYRWKILMNSKYLKNRFLWQSFNLCFICGCQIGLFILFTYPVYATMKYDDGKITPIFLLFCCLSFCMVIIETIGDQQQWNFQNAKAESKKNPEILKTYSHPEDIKMGFLTHGLFSYSRHPNYFGEVGFWWMIWFTSFSKLHNSLTSGIIGPLSLSILFIGSTIFTESITNSKYPLYKEYRRAVSPIIPFFHRKAFWDNLPQKLN
jgi:steroid 5-alpha reductase family enzyme